MLYMDNYRDKPTFVPPEETPVTDVEQVELLTMAAEEAGQEFWDDLIRTFETEVAPRFSEIRDTAQTKDAQGLRRIAHFVAGSAANMGLLRLSTLCRNIEREIDDQRFKAWEDVMPQVQREYEAALEAIRRLAKAA